MINRITGSLNALRVSSVHVWHVLFFSFFVAFRFFLRTSSLALASTCPRLWTLWRRSSPMVMGEREAARVNRYYHTHPVISDLFSFIYRNLCCLQLWIQWFRVLWHLEVWFQSAALVRQAGAGGSGRSESFTRGRRYVFTTPQLFYFFKNQANLLW